MFAVLMLQKQAPLWVWVGPAVELNPGIPSVEEWLRLVDQMLYQAKDQGRDQVVEMGELTPFDRVWLDV